MVSAKMVLPVSLLHRGNYSCPANDSFKVFITSDNHQLADCTENKNVIVQHEAARLTSIRPRDLVSSSGVTRSQTN